jgi:hypothetical protein
MSQEFLPLDALRKVTFRRLRTKSSNFATFFRSHRQTVKGISLIDCSVASDGLSSHTAEDIWLCVIAALDCIPDLNFSKLARLQSSSTSGYLSDGRNYRLDSDMTLKVTWDGKKETNTNLEYLQATHRTTTVYDSTLSCTTPHTLPLKTTYLNLR